MMKMKRNVKFEIRVKAGTNVEMKDEVFIAELVAAVGRAEQAANQENVRFHFEMGPTVVDDQTEVDEETNDVEENAE